MMSPFPSCVGETLDGQATSYLVDHQNFTGAWQVLEEKNAAGGVLRSRDAFCRLPPCCNHGRILDVAAPRL